MSKNYFANKMPLFLGEENYNDYAVIFGELVMINDLGSEAWFNAYLDYFWFNFKSKNQEAVKNGVTKYCLYEALGELRDEAENCNENEFATLDFIGGEFTVKKTVIK